MKAGSNHEYHILLGIEKISDKFVAASGIRYLQQFSIFALICRFCFREVRF